MNKRMFLKTFFIISFIFVLSMAGNTSTDLLAKSRTSTTNPKSWIYLESKENREGRPPQLILSTETGKQKLPVSKDTTLISYLEAKVWGKLPRLSISMNDTNRILLQFNISNVINSNSIKKAEVVFEMKQSKIPIVESFDLAVHLVADKWSEQSTCWDNQPAFRVKPAFILRVGPKAGTIRLNVTEIVKKWLSGAVPNNGILLKVASPTQMTLQTVNNSKVPDLTFPYLENLIEQLPWPHQHPMLNSEQIEKLNREIWVINDFPLYQSDEQGEWRYFHGAFDIVLDNGTKIYAIKDGWVKAINRSSIFIGDSKGKEPSYGWEYTHLGNHQVKTGDFVRTGTFIGEVSFRGLPHIHLAKVFSEGDYWGSWCYVCMPNKHFTYVDKEPPIIKTQFFFFQNDSNTLIQPNISGEIILEGDVDIVVGIRDTGYYARSKQNGFGDRLAVAKVDYEISSVSKERKTQHRFGSFDFRKINIMKSSKGRKYNTELTKIVYKHWRLFEAKRPHGNKFFSYYIITNCLGRTHHIKLTSDNRHSCWKTAILDNKGKRVFPDGKYDLKVTAYDFKGNKSTEIMRVTVINGKSK